MTTYKYEDMVGVAAEPFLKPNAVADNDASVWGAAMRQENSIYGAVNWMTQETYEPDPEFDWQIARKASPLADANPEPFYRARSQAEFDSIELQVNQELSDRRTLDSAGWAGVGAGMVMGVLDPTVALPGGMLAKGATALKVGASAAGWTMAGVATQEAILQGSQELRTAQESAANIAAGTVLAGLLGSAMGGMAKRDFDRISRGMVAREAELTNQVVSNAAPLKGDNVADEAFAASQASAELAGTGGAAKTPEVLLPDANLASAGGVEAALGRLDKVFAGTNPVIRNLSQGLSKTVQRAQAWMDSGGITLAKNEEGVASAPGGDVITRRKQWDALVAYGKRDARDMWKAHRYNGGKLSVKEFNVAVGQALEAGGDHADEWVKKNAQFYREHIFLPMFNEAKQLGMKGFDDLELEDALRYFPRNVKKSKAERERNDFIEILAQHTQLNMNRSWQKKFDKESTRADALLQQAGDISLDVEGTEQLRGQLEGEIAELPSQFADVEDVVRTIRAKQAQKRAADDKATKDALQAEIKALEADHAVELKPFKAAERKVRGRFRNLEYTKARLEAKQQRLLDRAASIENDQLATLERALKQGQRVLDKIDRNSDDAIVDGALTKLQDRINKAQGVYDRAEAKLDKMRGANAEDFEELVDSDVRPTDKISIGEAAQQDRLAKLAELNDKIDEAIATGEGRREVAEEALAMLQARTNRVNNKRALRREALIDRAKEIDPEGVAERARSLTQRSNDITSNIYKRASDEAGTTKGKLSGDNVRLRRAGGDEEFAQINFRARSEEIASELAGKLMGEGQHHNYYSVLMERGPELARSLNIDPAATWEMPGGGPSRTYGDFLEYDAEKATRNYVRTMGADMELYRKFGTVNPLEKGGELEQAINAEYDEAFAAAAEQYSGKALEKANDRITKARKAAYRDLGGVIDRIRHTRGVPEDPTAVTFRAGRVLQNLNTMRMMGSVVISSIPDIARPIMKHGLIRTFRDGFLPFIFEMQRVKLNFKELQASGVALDLTMHGRSAALYDMFDELEYGTKGEKMLQHATNKFGLISGFDVWNVGVKTFTGNIAMARISDELATVMDPNASARALRKANRFLGAHGIGEREARMMWDQFNMPGGSTRHSNGRLYPNTEAWVGTPEAVEATRAFRAAIARNVDDTIVTPGTERPLMMDQNQLARLFFQFRSFTYSSTMKVLLAGAQDLKSGDMAPVTGTIFSLALGAFAYYTWAMSRGGRYEEEMRNADVGTWANEAINRSGTLGMFAELFDAAERTPMLREALGGDTVRNRAFVGGPLERQLGPTFGSAIYQGDRLIKSDGVGELFKNAVPLLPYNNLAPLRTGFSLADKAGFDFPRDAGLIK